MMFVSAFVVSYVVFVVPVSVTCVPTGFPSGVDVAAALNVDSKQKVSIDSSNDIKAAPPYVLRVKDRDSKFIDAPTSHKSPFSSEASFDTQRNPLSPLPRFDDALFDDLTKPSTRIRTHPLYPLPNFHDSLFEGFSKKRSERTQDAKGPSIHDGKSREEAIVRQDSVVAVSEYSPLGRKDVEPYLPSLVGRPVWGVGEEKAAYNDQQRRVVAARPVVAGLKVAEVPSMKNDRSAADPTDNVRSGRISTDGHIPRSDDDPKDGPTAVDSVEVSPSLPVVDAIVHDSLSPNSIEDGIKGKGWKRDTERAVSHSGDSGFSSSKAEGPSDKDAGIRSKDSKPRLGFEVAEDAVPGKASYKSSDASRGRRGPCDKMNKNKRCPICSWSS